MATLTVHSDGGSRGNPGPAAVGVHAELDGERLFQVSRNIGTATNNVAEYTAVLDGMKTLISLHSSGKVPKEATIAWYLDSQLVVEQLMGRYSVKKPHIRELIQEVAMLRMMLPYPLTFMHVRREQNAEADALVNEALDSNKVR